MKLRLQPLFIAIFVVTFCSHSSFSQQSGESIKDTTFKFQKHSFQFRIADNFRLVDFNGSLLSYKHHFNNNIALRVGAEWRSYDRTETEDRHSYSSDTSNYRLDFKSIDSNIDFILQVIYYFAPKNEIKLYGGAGPYFSYQVGEDKIENVEISENIDNLGYNRLTDQQDYAIGLILGHGVEWFFRNNMSLIAEYELRAYYFNQTLERTRITFLKQENNDIDIRKNEQTGWRIESRGVKFGLSVYF